MTGRGALTLALTLALLLGARGEAAAQAASQPSAAGLLEQAIKSFDDGVFSRSRELLLRAQGLARDDRLLGQILLYLGLNAAVERGVESARPLFRQALGRDPRLRMDAERFKPVFVEAFEAVRAELIGTLRVSSNRPGITVWIDGAEAGPAPITRDVLAGPHAVELRDPQGAILLRREVRVQAGRAERIEFAVIAPPTSAPAIAPPTRSTPGGGPPPPPERRRRIWTWVAGAGALASLAVAIGLGVSAGSDHDQACALLADPERGCADRVRLAAGADPGRYEELYDAVRAKELAANIAWGVSGALAVTAIVLYLVEGRPSGRAGSANRSGPRALLGRGGLTLQLTY